MSSDSDRCDDKRGKKKEKKRYYKKKGGDAHVCREWDSNESSTDSSSDEDVANIAVNKGLLFPNVGHKCLMAKDGKKKKVQARTNPKYTTSSDEGSSSDDEENLLSLFANLNMQQKEKLNELIGAIHEKDASFKTFDASYVLTNKSGKVVAKYVGGKHKSSKTCVWVPKVLVSNVKGPKTVLVPKNKA